MKTYDELLEMFESDDENLGKELEQVDYETLYHQCYKNISTYYNLISDNYTFLHFLNLVFHVDDSDVF